MEAFVADRPPDAYEQVVDRLLARPHFGERWARHWLDPARFAESHGYEHDYLRPFAYHYRDFVIQALNPDLPYDTFVRWQLAGDELAPGDHLALAATGFLAAGRVADADHQERGREGALRRARRHALDHLHGDARHHRGLRPLPRPQVRPDPQRDYYRLLSTFTTTVRSDVEVDRGTAAEQAATRAFEETLKPSLEVKKRLGKRLAARLRRRPGRPRRVG